MVNNCMYGALFSLQFLYLLDTGVIVEWKFTPIFIAYVDILQNSKLVRLQYSPTAFMSMSIFALSTSSSS